jgi:aldehyde dehydrogenase (NAD+)
MDLLPSTPTPAGLMVVDGELREARSGARYASINPTTEAELAPCADGGAEDALEAVVAARRCFDETSWSKHTDLRRRCLQQLAEGLRRHEQEFRTLLVDEVGITFSGMFRRFARPVSFLSYCAEQINDELASDIVLPVMERDGRPVHRIIQHLPAGVVAAIAAYNSPFQLILAKIGPSLAVGCTAVVKVAPQTPAIGALFSEVVANETDLPPGALNIVTSSGPEPGVAMVTDRRVDVVTFTGSRAVGVKVAGSCATSVKKVLLELGGKSANVVLDDLEDIDAIVRGNVVRMVSHAGQGCGNLTRLVVPRGLHDRVVAVAASSAADLVWGDPRNPTTQMGPLVSAAQQARVLGFIERGLADGGRLVAGGRAGDRPGWFVEPTIFTDVDPMAELAQEEVFGPVLVIQTHEGDDDAIRIANLSEYGLGGAVWSGSPARGLAVARRIRTGTMDVNGADFIAHDTPFGGLKQSGLGKEMGRAGFDEFLQQQVIAFH